MRPGDVSLSRAHLAVILLIFLAHSSHARVPSTLPNTRQTEHQSASEFWARASQLISSLSSTCEFPSSYTQPSHGLRRRGMEGQFAWCGVIQGGYRSHRQAREFCPTWQGIVCVAPSVPRRGQGPRTTPNRCRGRAHAG